MSAGFSIIELLVITSILAVLTALLFSVFVRARIRTKTADDIAHLRQIGIAEEIYSTDSGGIHRYSLTDLVDRGYVPKELVASALDVSREGYHNERLRYFVTPPKLGSARPYKISYYSLGSSYGIWDVERQQLSHQLLRSSFEGDPDAGWAASPFPEEKCGFDSLPEFLDFCNRKVIRLRMDGSIKVNVCPANHGVASGTGGLFACQFECLAN